MIRRFLIPALALLAALSAAVEPAFAQRGRDRDRDDDRDRAPFSFQQSDPRQNFAPPGNDQRKVPLGTVLRNLQQKFGGRHLDAKESGNRYIIAWITQDGRRLTIEVDATSGRVISER
jgi:uncharacterized membrane protein YkoI